MPVKINTIDFMYRHLDEPALFGKGETADNYETGRQCPSNFRTITFDHTQEPDLLLQVVQPL